LTTTEPTSRYDTLPGAEILKQLQKMEPALRKEIFLYMDKDARHIQKIAWFRMLASLVITLASIAATVYLGKIDAPWVAGGTAVTSAIVVAVTMITGRPPKDIRINSGL
jgi:hypothetical protein